MPCSAGVGQGGEHPLQHAGDLRQARPRTCGRSDPRSRYSIAMYGVPSCWRYSCTVTMFGCPSEPVMRDSCRKRAAAAGSVAWNAAELLQRDVAVEVGLAGQVHDGHAAPADLADDLEAPDALALAGHG